MSLKHLELARFRCLDSARLTFHPRCNLIVGSNGSGKTSLLEGIYLLSSGRSFRTHQTDLLIQQGQESLLSVAHVADGSLDHVLGMELSRSERRSRIDGEPCKGLAELARMLPVQVIDPAAHQLLEDGPAARRRFMDWGVFHVKPNFQTSWRHFTRALEQRNAVLKKGGDDASLSPWEELLALHGEQVNTHREQYVEELRPFVKLLGLNLLGHQVDIDYHRGWSRDETLAAALLSGRNRDRLRGATGSGPHRADLVVKVDGLNARDRVSRGQQKMLACTLLLAQQQQRCAEGHAPACLLIDDPAAELDVDNLGKLLTAVAETPAQLVITGLSKEAIQGLRPDHLFHVERGRVEEMA